MYQRIDSTSTSTAISPPCLDGWDRWCRWRVCHRQCVITRPHSAGFTQVKINNCTVVCVKVHLFPSIDMIFGFWSSKEKVKRKLKRVWYHARNGSNSTSFADLFRLKLQINYFTFMLQKINTAWCFSIAVEHVGNTNTNSQKPRMCTNHALLIYSCLSV